MQADNSEPTELTRAVVRANLSAHRQQTGLRLEDVSASLKASGWPVSVSALSRIENGERRIDVDDLTALAAALGVSPIVLLNPRGSKLTGLPDNLIQEEIIAWLRGDTRIDDHSLQDFWERDLKQNERRISELNGKAFVTDSESHKRILEHNLKLLTARRELAVNRLIELQERTGREIQIFGTEFPPFDPLEKL